MFPQKLAVALSALTVVTASTTFTINPDDISATQAADWCQAELNTCPILCDNDYTSNTCDTTTLAYNCTCSNGSAPGLQYYTETMPTFICQEAYSLCISANANNATGQEACTDDIEDQCGTLDPANYTAAATSATTAAATSTKASTATSTSAAATSTSKSSSNAAAVVGNGVAAVAAGLFAVLL